MKRRKLNMAKLDGIKVVNGNTVEYNGFVYALVGQFDEETEIGNLLKCTHSYSDFTVGAFYKVIHDSKKAVIDDVGDNPIIGSSKFDVFRKSHAITNDKLTDAEGVVKITLPDGTKLEGTPSDLEKITRKLQEMQAEQVDVSTKDNPAETVEVEDASEPVQSCLQVDDYAKVIVDTCDVFEEGEIVKIIHTDSSILPYKGEQLSSDRYEWLYESDVVRATEAEVKAATEPKEEPLKVGDYAKVVEEDTHGFNEGDVVRIYDIVDYGSNRIRGEYLSGKRIGCDYFFEHELVRATDAEVLEAKQALLKEGDFARVIGRSNNHDFEIGTVVKLGAKDSNTDGTEFFKSFYLDKSDYWYVRRCDLEPLTAEEAEHIAREAEEEKKAKAEREEKEAERLKWAAIGREVGELRNGDTVHLAYRDLLIGKVLGLNEKHSSPSEPRYYVDFGERNHGICTEKASDLVLIAPSESLFNQAPVTEAAERFE
ncbi:hypothetical protein [Bacillus gaemokensis]|nr:hypothetical protein [Bacillus gaemokensis]